MFDQIPPENEMFNAVLNKDAEYQGRFWFGVQTTGVFCNPGCPARNSNPDNIELFASTRQALAAGYRPCKKCHPLHTKNTPKGVKVILLQAEQDLFKEWHDEDFQEYQIDCNQLNRWFQKNHQITFSHYLHMRRLGTLLGQIKHGSDDKTSPSLQTFKETLNKLLDSPAGKDADTKIYLNRISTPLGPMLAGASDEGLYLLEFVDRSRHEKQLQKIAEYANTTFTPGSNQMMDKVANQLHQYFDGTLKEFSILIIYSGTEFQQRVWKQLQTIPYAHTLAYQEQAEQIGNKKAVRAVARANGKNRISVIIPCHRVIGKDGSLTGYGGGLWRKKELLNLEQANA